MSSQVDDFLAHVGVKGMRWGVRKNDDGGSSGSSGSSGSNSGGGSGSGGGDGTDGGKGKKPKYEESRREYRKRTRAEAQEFYDKKAESIVNESLKRGDEILVKTFFHDGYDFEIVTGKEFVQHLERGRAFNTPFTEIWAERDTTGTRTENGVKGPDPWAYRQTDGGPMYQKTARR